MKYEISCDMRYRVNATLRFKLRPRQSGIEALQ